MFTSSLLISSEELKTVNKGIRRNQGGWEQCIAQRSRLLLKSREGVAEMLVQLKVQSLVLISLTSRHIGEFVRSRHLVSLAKPSAAWNRAPALRPGGRQIDCAAPLRAGLCFANDRASRAHL